MTGVSTQAPVGVVIFIPARFASSRFPGKPLALLTGATGVAKSLVQRAWEAAMRAPGVDAAHVVTDDARVAEAADAFGASVLMTSPDCANGTERCAEAVGLLSDPPEIVINLQGDAPLTPPHFVTALIEAMAADPAIPMATPVLRAEAEGVEALLEDRAQGRVGATTAVLNHAGDALYFSKEVLPFSSGGRGRADDGGVWHHVGLYAYRPDALKTYAAAPSGPLERTEGLEQLRFLENGVPVRCVPVEADGAKFWEVNNPGDIAIVEAGLRAGGVE